MKYFLDPMKLNVIRTATADEISDIVLAAQERFHELHPDWELHIITVEKAVDKNEQIDAVIALMERLKEQ